MPSIPYRGILTAVNPLDALTDSSPKDKPDTAPAAAAWLRNPEPIKQKLTCAQRLMLDLEQNGEWTPADKDTAQ